MYKTLIGQIATILGGVKAVKAVYSWPIVGAPEKSPAVVFFSDGFENTFETNASNLKQYRFQLHVFIDLAGTTEREVFQNALPNVVDQIVAAFDAAWDGGTHDGHRIWQIIDIGAQPFIDAKDGKIAVQTLTLRVNLLTDI